MKRRREVMIEIEREIVISNHHHHRSWCADCDQEVQMLRANEAAQVTGLDEASIYDRAALGLLHIEALAPGMLLVCPNSLFAWRNAEQMQPMTQLLIAAGASPPDQSNL